MTDKAEQNVFGRAWSAWRRFWFSPADPTPLCLMRIAAGLLTLYVHIAYSFDLVDFFGPHGWVDHTESNRVRHGMPHILLRTDWAETRDFQMPEDVGDREVLCKFIEQLDSIADMDNVLFFMHSFSSLGEERNELLRYVQQPFDKVEFESEIRAFVDDKLPAEAKEKLPRMFQRQITPESRKSFADALIRFRNLLPDDYKERSRLLQLFIKTSSEDWDYLGNLVRQLRDMSEADRNVYLKEFAEWQVSPKIVYARGMNTFSPWFHTKDIRFLWLIHGLYLLAIFSFMVGYQTRVAAVITWLAGLSYINRAQPYLFGQDTMMNLSLIYLMLSPCGARWSVDRWLARKRAEATGEKLPPVEPSVSAGFVLRVFQIQFCLMYFSAGLSKLKGTMWWNGSALHLCMANPEFSPMHVGAYRDLVHWLCSHRVAWELAGTGTSVFTLLTEITFPYLIWTRMRPALIVASLMLHTGIAILMGLTVFSLYMFVLVLCFFPPETINWMLGTEAEGALQ
jgi:hypothetical protein